MGADLFFATLIQQDDDSRLWATGRDTSPIRCRKSVEITVPQRAKTSVPVSKRPRNDWVCAAVSTLKKGSNPYPSMRRARLPV